MDNKSIICIALSGLLVSGTTNASSDYKNPDSNNLQESNRDKLSIINPQLQPQNRMEQSNTSYNESGVVENPMFQDETSDAFDRYQIKRDRANSDLSQEDIARAEVIAPMMHQSAKNQEVSAEILRAQVESLNRENQANSQDPNEPMQTQMTQDSNELMQTRRIPTPNELREEQEETSQIQNEPVQMQEVFDQNDLTGEEIIQQEFQQDNRTRREKVHDFFYRGVVFFGHLEGSMKNSVAKLVMSILKNICKAFVTALRVDVPEVDQELGGAAAQNQQTRPNTPAVIPGRRTPAITSGSRTPTIASRVQSPAPISRMQTPTLRAQSPVPTSMTQSQRSRSRSASPARTSTPGRKLIRQSPSPYSSLRQSRSAADAIASGETPEETLTREIPAPLTPSDDLRYSPDPEEQAQ